MQESIYFDWHFLLYYRVSCSSIYLRFNLGEILIQIIIHDIQIHAYLIIIFVNRLIHIFGE